ncbi:MAG: gamma-glutamyl-phosphate reductase, partial [Halomonas venusta]|nr:gamma-glutamyl-phosphate reductase [Halomonas venusta]
MSGSNARQNVALQQLAAGDVPAYIQVLGQGARAAARELRRADTGLKNRALEAMASRLTASRQLILEANALDLQRGKESGLDTALL